jgi:hypothetical protein
MDLKLWNDRFRQSGDFKYSKYSQFGTNNGAETCENWQIQVIQLEDF